jgi:hypothetical protein
MHSIKNILSIAKVLFLRTPSKLRFPVQIKQKWVFLT